MREEVPRQLVAAVRTLTEGFNRGASFGQTEVS
jgi:hypothetical protein